MMKVFKILGWFFIAILAILLVLALVFYMGKRSDSAANMELLGEAAPMLRVDGKQFRDLNKNGQLDLYEDSRVDIETRIEDLLSQMNLEEKAGAMFITISGMNPNGELNEIPSFKEPISFAFESSSSMIAKKKMNHFNIMQSESAEALMNWNNNVQKLAERTRLGIPVTIASDPRHGAADIIGPNVSTPFFSKWCSPSGFAAIDDTLLIREFGDIARQEYRAVGIHLALSPMADLATEPRWGRINGTFGEDAKVSARMTKAYVLGFQGDSLTHEGVACMTKHFSGGGPQKDGEDAHFDYGAEQAYPGNKFDYHLIPFEEGAFPAKTAAIMPYYGIPVGQTDEDVAFGFNKQIITGLLREKYGYDGLVCTDWGLITDLFVKPASAWGVEDLTPKERVVKVIDAGCDMFGGEAIPELIIQAVNDGDLTEARLDVSVRRILREKFRLGLFDNPYLEASGLEIVGNDEFVQKGRIAQERSMVLLKNEGNLLPLSSDKKIYIKGMDSEQAKNHPNAVATPEEADVIVMKLITPHDPRTGSILERVFRQGRLNFDAEEKAEILPLLESKASITIMTLDRPTVFPDINSKSQAVIGDFFCEDIVALDLIFGKFQPTGKLPFEIPSSMEAVVAQKEDVPYDSANPLYSFGFGLRFGGGADIEAD